MQRKNRSRWFQDLAPVCVVSVAALWVWLGGDATARFVRRVFAVLDPVAILEVGAGFAVIGIAVRLVQVETSRRVSGRLGLWGRRLVGQASVSTGVVLSVVVSLVAVVRVVLGRANHYPKVLGDELIYSGLAKGWALHGQPLVRGSRDFGQSLLYPLLLAPAFRLTRDGASALEAVKAMDAVVVALTAIPAYFLARRVVPRPWALAVAAVTVLGPWTAYSSLSLTESLFYPLFVTYAAVLPWVLARPSIVRQVVMLALLVVLVATRAQALAVAVGTLAAIVLLGALDAGVLSMLRRFRLTLVALAVALAIGLAAAIAGIVVPTSSYNAVFDSLPRLGGMLKWGVWNLAAFEFALGVTLFAAVPVALSEMLRSGRDRPTRVTGTVISTLSLSVLGSVALLSASPYGLHILHERNLFYVTPLLATGVAHWLSVGLPRPRWLAVGTACATVVLAVVLPVGVILHPNVVDSPTAGFWLALKEQIPAVPVRVWTILLAGIGAVTFLVAKRPLFPVLTMLLAFAAVTSQTDYRDGLTADQAKALAWVDHALPPRATSTLIHLGLAQSSAPCAAPSAVEEDDFVVWTEYFNTRIDSVEHVYAANPRDGLGSRELTVGSGGIILDQGKPFRPAYLVIDSRQPIVGTRLQRFDLQTIHSPFLAGASLTLWRVDPPLRFYSRPQPLPPRADGHQC